METVEIKKGQVVRVARNEPFDAPYDMVIISAEKYKQDEALLKTATDFWKTNNSLRGQVTSVDGKAT